MMIVHRDLVAACAALGFGVLALGSGDGGDVTEPQDAPAAPTPEGSAPSPAAVEGVPGGSSALPAGKFFTEPDLPGHLCRTDETVAYGCDGMEDGRIALCAGADWLQLRVRLPDGTLAALPHDPENRFVLTEDEGLPNDGVRDRAEVVEGEWSAILYMDSYTGASGLMEPRGHVAFARHGTVTKEYACDPAYGARVNSTALMERAVRK